MAGTVRAKPKPSTQDILEQLSRTVLTLVIDHPFFGHLAGGMARAMTPDQPWPLALLIAEGRYTLSVSPRRFLALGTRQRVVAMEHELLHAVLGHPQRAAAHPEAGELYGMACDLVVNQLLSSGPPLPGAFTLDRLPAEHRTPDLTVEEYLTVLKHLYPCLVRGSLGCRAGGSLTCGSGGGSLPCPGQAGRSPNGVPAGSHPWGAVSLSAAQLAQAGFDPLVRETALRVAATKAYGRLPAGVRAHLAAIIEAYQPTLDWRRVLRMFSSGSRRNRVRATLRRPSRRYHTYPGIRITRGQRLAVCVDTSGSIEDWTLVEFFSEIHQIWRAGAEVVVFEVDAEVQRTWEYRGVPPTLVTGRGGTDFEPGLRAVRETVPRFDACVYLTDGHGPRPAAGSGTPLLWLVTPDGTIGPQLTPGQRVRMRAQTPG